MTDVKIRIFKEGETQPEKTITIPGKVLGVASKLIPKKAVTALQEEGIDLDELIKLSKDPDISGTLVEIEEHKKKEKVVISLE